MNGPAFGTPRQPVVVERFTGTVTVDASTRLSYLHAASRQPGDLVHQKDRQTLLGYAEVLAGQPAPESVLEIGIYSGGSLALWKALWPSAIVVGVDVTLEHVDGVAAAYLRSAGVACHVLRMPNAEAARLGTFDLIIDDGAHGATSVLGSFAVCWPMLNPGGLYVVEDWHLAAFDPVRIAGTLSQKVIGVDHGEHFCDGPFPTDSAERVVILRRLVAVFKRTN